MQTVFQTSCEKISSNNYLGRLKKEHRYVTGYLQKYSTSRVVYTWKSLKHLGVQVCGESLE